MLPLLSPLFATPLFATLAFADNPLGQEIKDGVLVDVSGTGLGLVEDLAGDLVPPRTDLAPFGFTDSSGCVPFIGCASNLEVDLSGAFVELEIGQLALRPGTDALTLEVDLTVYLNRSNDPADLYLYAEILGLDLIDETCDLYLDPINLSFDAAVQLDLRHDPNGRDLDGDGQPDTQRLDVVIPPATWTWDADEGDFNFGGCGTADVVNVINDITSFFGFNIYDEILALIEPAIDDVVADLPASIEPAIEDLFQEFIINEEIDLLGTPLTLTLWPSTVTTAPPSAGNTGGMRVGLSTIIDVPAAACVEKYAIDASLATPSQPPQIGAGGGGGTDPAATAFVDDDFVNHLLFAAWKGGLLCQVVSADSEDISLPLPLDTGLLTILAPNVFTDLFPAAAPMEIRIDPREPPTADPTGPHDFDIAAHELGVGFVADIDGRKSRFVEISIDADAGIDLTWDNAIGAVAIEVALDGDALQPTVTANEFKPESSDAISGQFSVLFDLLVGPLLDDALSGLTFPVGTIEGLGITGLDVGTAGTNGDWTGVHLEAGVPTYYAVGCDTSEGCDTSSCSKGCSQGGAGGQVVFVLVPLVIAALRRRR
jgi:hypothetical protein